MLTLHDKRFLASGLQGWMRPLLVAASLLWAGMACGDLGETSESRVKAAFLFKFTGYVNWPSNAFEQADAPLTMCAVEADEVASELARLVAGRTAGTRPMTLRRLSAADGTNGCHVLFVGSAVGSRTSRIINAARTQSVLTVTELDDAPTFGSVINFVVVDDQVRFDVSLPAAERGNLKISARLLAVARQVLTVPSS